MSEEIKKEGPSSLRNQIMKNQKNRIDNGEIVTYKNGIEHLVSPGYTTVSWPALKTALRASGMGSLVS